jgi:hypothetical protein
MTEREEAVHEAAEALGLLSDYCVTASMTARVHYTESVAAASVEEAIAMAKQANYFGNQVFDYEGDGCEGDEIIYILPLDDRTADGTEVDCRADGEPFSWEACQIVKDLAKLKYSPLDSATFAEFIKRAVSACTKEEV